MGDSGTKQNSSIVGSLRPKFAASKMQSGNLNGGQKSKESRRNRKSRRLVNEISEKREYTELEERCDAMRCDASE